MENLPKQKTKIVATIGPASAEMETLQAMIEAGLSIARINFAHGDFASHEQTITNVRAAAGKTGRRVAIFGDLPGPKMRIGQLAEEPIQLEIGQTFTLQTEPMIGNRERVYVQFDGLTDAVKPGDAIYMNDGYIQLRVESVEADAVHCLVRVGGELRSYKGVNFPGIDLGISAFTDQDREFLAFAAGQKLDGVSQSFVATAADIRAVREAAAALDYHPLLIAKIERAGALEHLEEIIAAADGIMVARGDLGRGALALQVQLAQIRIVDAQKRRRLARGQLAHRFRGIGRKQAFALRVQLRRKPFGMLANNRIQVFGRGPFSGPVGGVSAHLPSHLHATTCNRVHGFWRLVALFRDYCLCRQIRASLFPHLVDNCGACTSLAG